MDAIETSSPRTPSSSLLQRAALALLALAVLAGAWWTPPDAAARREVEAGLTRALTTYAAARTLGAVLAVAQGTQMAVQPAGVGMTLAPGQALKPLSDLIEQFSTLMLAASVAYGVHLLLLAMGAHWMLSALLTAALLTWTALRWPHVRGAAGPARAQPWLRRLSPLLLALLLLRFGAPLIALGNEAVYRTFMAQDYAAAQSAIAGATQAAQAQLPQAAPLPQGEGLLERLQRIAPKLPDWGAQYERIKAQASDAVRYLISLLAVFLLQTVVIPVGMLWALWRLGRGLIA